MSEAPEASGLRPQASASGPARLPEQIDLTGTDPTLPVLHLRRSQHGPIRIEVLGAGPQPLRAPRFLRRADRVRETASAYGDVAPAAPAPAAAPLDPGTPLDALEYVVVDVETTGGAALRGHRITELALLRVSACGRIVEEFQTLVNPQRPIPPFVTRLTNITHDMVAAAPLFEHVASDVQRLLAGAVFVAHNANFDHRFITWELERIGRAGPPQSRALCTVRLARRVLPEVRRRSLDSLAFYFGVEIRNRHRAYGDARATVDVFAALLRRAGDRDVTSWGALDSLLRRRAARRKRSALPRSMDDF